MKKIVSAFLFFCTIILSSSFCASNSKANTDHSVSVALPDSVIIDTIDFRDMNDEYIIVQYKINDNIIQMDIDRKASQTKIDYILWDMNKNGKMEAIAVYNVLGQKYDYHLIEEELIAENILEYQVQIEDIGFPSFYDSSNIPKAVYKSKEHQPEINHY